MRKIIFLPLTAITLLIFSGCTKSHDSSNVNPDDPPGNCRIKKISFDEMNPDGEISTGYVDFSYNAKDNPSSIQYNTPANGVSLPDRQDKGFSYDDHDRLRVYASDAFITFWHLYTYVSATKITDSVFVYSSGDYTVNDHPDEYAYVNVSELTLDSFGRIIKESINEAGGYTSEKTFQYDTEGNLIRSGVTYTNKPNIRQTGKVWKFIDRDYSKNQPEGEVETFNTYNLPHKFKNERLQSGDSELPIFALNTIVEYDCD